MRPFVLTRTYYQKFNRYISPIIATVIIVLFVRVFVADSYKIPSNSMQPTLVEGDHVVGLKIIYGIRIPFGGPYIRFFAPKKADLVVIKRADGNNYIKRVVALNGDTVEMSSGKLKISGKEIVRKFGTDVSKYRYIDNDSAVYREFLDKEFYSVLYSGSKRTEDLPLVKLSKGQMFLLGDNRTNSVDSRSWGPVKEDDLLAKVVFVWFSKDPVSGKIRWDRFGLIGR